MIKQTLGYKENFGFEVVNLAKYHCASWLYVLEKDSPNEMAPAAAPWFKLEIKCTSAGFGGTLFSSDQCDVAEEISYGFQSPPSHRTFYSVLSFFHCTAMHLCGKFC